jgi:hypothetical protein
VKLGVLAVLRDEAANLPRFFAALEDLERQPGIRGLVPSFYENDSCDGTVELLRQWVQGRPGGVISEQLGVARIGGRAPQRTVRLAAARNAALQQLLAWSTDLVLVVDADLQFTAQQVLQLLAVLQSDSRIAMACASAIQNVADLFGRGAWSYYDSWALQDRGGRPGITMAAVPFWTLEDRAAWLAGRPVAVASAFGGMALLRTSTICDHGLHWHGAAGCEHWAFCAGARQAGVVVACPAVTPLVIHPTPPHWKLAYRDQKRLQLRQFWQVAGLGL